MTALALAAGGGGCMLMQRGEIPGGGEQLVVRNYGWYLFDFLPIGCGNASKDARFPFVIFRDDVDIDVMQRRFMAEAGGKKASDLVYTNYDSKWLTLPLLYLEVPVPYIVTYRETQLSGVVK